MNFTFGQENEIETTNGAFERTNANPGYGHIGNGRRLRCRDQQRQGHGP
jgi:hypothetical protein